MRENVKVRFGKEGTANVPRSSAGQYASLRDHEI